MGVPKTRQKEKMIYTVRRAEPDEKPSEKEEIVSTPEISSQDVVEFLGWAIFGPLIVMFAWNWSLPYLFGFKVLNYFQALCLLVLSRYLIK